MQGGERENSGKCRTTAVIPNYNGITYLEECLSSLYAGTRVPAVIVVDNGSTDGSAEVCRKFPRVKLVCLKENTGFCHAVNRGIKEAETEVVFLLNNDTRVKETCVEELEKAIGSSKKIFSASAKMINMKFPEKIDDAGDFYCVLGWAFARGKDKPVSRYDKPGRIFASCGGAAIYRKEIFDRIGLFDEAHFAYLEDIDIGYRANLFGFRSEFAPRAEVLHAGSGVSGSRHNEFKVKLSSRNSVYLIFKNMPLLQLLFNLPLLLLGFAVKTVFFARKGLGGVYSKGLLNGLALSFSKEGKSKRVRFCLQRLPYYFWVQWELILSFLYFL